MENYREKICAFFGHAHICEDEKDIEFLYKETKKQIENLILNEDISIFWYGGYGEFDQLAVKAFCEVQEKYPHIKIWLILAYVSQLHRNEPFFIFNDFIYLPELETVPKRFAIRRRNDWMSKNCDFVISYVYAETGGAYEALKVAQRAKKTIINIANQLLF